MMRIDLLDLCNEAKVERCRATRELRRCGQHVLHVLASCGHASLCVDCSRVSDLCPICRVPLPRDGTRLRLRLYYQCLEAGLISRCWDEENEKNYLTADVQHLYSLFDVALENNMVSLICHYVTDVCMNESAVSSDPVVAFLLDEVAVKDWCRRAFKNITQELHKIYKLGAQEMKTRLSLLLKHSVNLAGLSDVLEVMVSAFHDTISAHLSDLQLLQDFILKTKHHTEIMIWGIRHQFLENVRSRYADIMAWHSVVLERKAAAIRRCWPDAINQSAVSASLFIEDALENLGIELGYGQELGEQSELASLHMDGGLIFSSKIEGMAGCYPFESFRVAADVLFLRGSSDLLVAKKAIFLYYLFDRHWTVPEESWIYIVNDFVATFSVARHSLLESLVFYLLDDHTDEALQEACSLLPEISGPSTHPKIGQVLLEREVPETSLMVLHWSGKDGCSQMVSLSEAVTCVRARVECGLLSEALMYQRMLSARVRGMTANTKHCGQHGTFSNGLSFKSRTWEDWVEVLVTEICCLCIKRSLVDRMIELPWNLYEQKYLQKCLLDCALHDPSTTIGCLLVVFYLQRYQYAEAYEVDRKLQRLEQDYISKYLNNEKVLQIQSACRWRSELVEMSIELLPLAQQQQITSGKWLSHMCGEEIQTPTSDLHAAQDPMLLSIMLSPQSADCYLGSSTNPHF